MSYKLLIVFALSIISIQAHTQESTIDQLYLFQGGQPAIASQVNENFNFLLNKINTLEARLSIYESENLGSNDPLIGEWSCIVTYDSGQVNQPITQYFFESGSISGRLFSCWITGWERQGDDIIIHKSNCNDYVFTPWFSSDNTLLNMRFSTSAAECTKVI